MRLVWFFAHFAERPMKHIEFTPACILWISRTLRSYLPYNAPIHIINGLRSFYKEWMLTALSQAKSKYGIILPQNYYFIKEKSNYLAIYMYT